MYEALRLAHRGLGWVSPNPAVGALLVRDGNVIGQGAHLHDGQEHAEVLALRDAGSAAGATCYITLEPCTHVGRQPACTQELAQAGVSRVVYGAQDGDPRTTGQAQRVLAELGIPCTGGVLKRECSEFLDYYLYGHCLHRSFNHLKLALSADAKLACANGHSQWLSGPESLGYAHYLRQKYDAVLVGYKTVLADDPRLTVRPEVLESYWQPESPITARNPVRVILDPRFELLPLLSTLRLSNYEGAWRNSLPRIVLVGHAVHVPQPPPDIPGLVLLTPSMLLSGAIDLLDMARQLYVLGIHSLLIEGGARLAQEILRQQAVDKITLVYTATLIGADGMGYVPDFDCRAVGECLKLARNSARVLGGDCVLEGYPAWPEQGR